MRDITTVFVDRDGTLNVKAREGDYVKSRAEFAFLPGAKDALRLMSSRGLRVIVVTNQRGIALGRMSADDVDEIHAQMLSEIRAGGGEVDAVYVCPHGLDACRCRKPEVGMFLQAKEDFPEISFDRAVMIGDSISDMVAAEKIGAMRILIAPAGRQAATADHTTSTLWHAARWIDQQLGG